MGTEADVLLFHEKTYVDFVKEKSKTGEGFLDYGDTPAFPGVYEAALYTVGGTLDGLDQILKGRVDHFFNPIGGLHHARRARAGGFCVFDDPAIAISKCIEQLDPKMSRVVYVDIDAHHRYANTTKVEDELPKFPRVAYVDIDAHHGDGVYYGFEE